MTEPLRRRLLLSLLAGSFAASPEARNARRPARQASAAGVVDDAAPDLVTYGSRADVMRFAAEGAARQGLDETWLRNALAEARFIPSVTRYIMPPPAGTAKDWASYRSRFVEPVRLREGERFWSRNAEALQRAEAMYGVPPEIVVAIVGVESIYGRQMGNFRIVDSLATLGFDFPKGRTDRSEFFRAELEQWFVLCKKQGLDPLLWRGSYAGAFGMPQFIPSSFNRYAVDFDGDGRVDLHGSGADVAGSVAHYLAEFGWQRGLPVRFDVKVPVDSAARARLLGPDILPTFSAAAMVELGAALPEEAAHAETLLALVELQNGAAAPTYYAGTTNFYAITRYNRSSYYAMAVNELAIALRERHPPPAASPPAAAASATSTANSEPAPAIGSVTRLRE